jgi:hypothetical protein
MSMYEAGPVGQVAHNLLTGYGYNFYKAENQLRQDDQRLRALAGSILARARGAVEAAESAWRRERMPPPTRAKPFPDADAVAGAQALERLGGEIGALAGRIQAAPAPGNDRMTERYRLEAQTLAALVEADSALIEQVDGLRAQVEPLGGAALLEAMPQLTARLAAIAERLAQRQLLLA